MSSRRGFTMVELILGLVLTLMVGGVTYEVLLRNQRVARAQTEHVGMQENVRAGALIIANEFREIGFDSIPPLAVATLGAGGPTAGANDIVDAKSNRVQYKAMRGMGFLCSLVGNTAIVTRSTVVGIRAPVVGDSVSIYVEGDEDTNTDDAWVNAEIAALPNGNCPNGDVGIAMTLDYPNWLNAVGFVAQVNTGAPVRLFDVMEMQTLEADGRSWLGLRSMTIPNEALQAVVGPIVDSTAVEPGLEFTYLDRDGLVTANVKAIRTVEITLRGLTDQPTRSTGTYVVDTLELTTRVALRNTLRP